MIWLEFIKHGYKGVNLKESIWEGKFIGHNLLDITRPDRKRVHLESKLIGVKWNLLDLTENYILSLIETY